MNKLSRYNDTYWSLCSISDKCFQKCIKRRKNLVPTDSEEVERISLSRTRSTIKEICLCNSFEYFMTVTVSSQNCDRFSLQDVQDRMKKLFKKIKRKYTDFKYIFITEKHEKGGFHFHGMIKGIPKQDLKLFTVNDNIPWKLKRLILMGDNIYHFNIFDNEMGWNTFSPIKDYNKCCSYITKYITESCIRNEHNQIYFCSRGLKRAEEELMIDTDLNTIFENVFENEYCQKKDFDITTLSEQEKLKLNRYFNLNDEIFQKDNNYITNWLKLFTNFGNRYKIQIHK